MRNELYDLSHAGWFSRSQWQDLGVSSVRHARNVGLVWLAGALVGAGITPARAVETTAYVSNNQSNSVSVVNTLTGSLLATIPVGGGPYGVAIAKNGKTVYVANAGSDNVSVISAATNAVIATLSTGPEPSSIAITPDGTRAYVTNTTHIPATISSVAVINVRTNRVGARIHSRRKSIRDCDHAGWGTRLCHQ